MKENMKDVIYVMMFGYSVIMFHFIIITLGPLWKLGIPKTYLIFISLACLILYLVGMVILSIELRREE